MPRKLNPEFTASPERRNNEKDISWQRRYAAAETKLWHHLADVVPGKLYAPGDTVPTQPGWEVSVVKFPVGERIFVPKFQFTTRGELYPTVAAVGIRLSTHPIGWGGLALWWVTPQDELGCAPYTLLGTKRRSELLPFAGMIADRC